MMHPETEKFVSETAVKIAAAMYTGFKPDGHEQLLKRAHEAIAIHSVDAAKHLWDSIRKHGYIEEGGDD